jgi:hypothetical protein
MGQLVAKLGRLPPMQVGDIFTLDGQSVIFRVVGDHNEVERYVGNRAKRRAKLSDWKRKSGER